MRTFENANVTAPYKRDVARILGSELPSVNTIAGGIGHSTDAAILDGLTAERPVIVGDGGAAAAFRAALPQARVFSRKTEWPPDVADADLVVHATPVRDDVLSEFRPRGRRSSIFRIRGRRRRRQRLPPARPCSTDSRCSSRRARRRSSSGRACRRLCPSCAGH